MLGIGFSYYFSPILHLENRGDVSFPMMGSVRIPSDNVIVNTVEKRFHCR